MTRGERAVLAGGVLLAVPVVLLIRAAELPDTTELVVYVGTGLLLLAIVAAIDRRHKQRRKTGNGED